ncbi:hypothetical protein [Nodosilinea sp. LEGE 07298]|uniref:hypothetical protein n=1 Tax=Nodosilinea sp. LEGE 07298 TaxID=2777970 RepID=UPI001D14255D|nr:hypothetical protein [Nodosilinea sp. LEGE 07298]
MMLSLRPIPLSDLLLSRLLFADTNGMTISELKVALKAIAGSELSNTAYTEQIETTLTNLSEQDYTQPVSSSRHQLSGRGRQHILNGLRLKTLPPRLQWKTLKNTDWIAHALNLPALSTETRRRLAEADGLRAAILQQGFDLSIAPFSTLTQARNALLWQHLCNPKTAEKLQTQLPDLQQHAFNQGTVMAALLNDLLQAPKPLPWDKALSQLVARVAQAKRTTPDELRTAILRQALTSTEPVPQKPDTSNKNDLATLSDEEFAELTLNAAKATQDGRLGDSKVFISRVWATLQQQHPDLKLSLEGFKQRLVNANQQRRLDLSRADLAYALDAKDVSASEINHLNSTFHFIRLD